MDSDKKFRELIDRSFTGEISERERQIIHSHIRDCNDCKRYMELTARTIRGLREFAFATGESHIRLRDILAHHAGTMRQHNVQLKVRTAFALALSMSLVGSLFAWWLARFLAVQMHFGIAQAQAGVLVFWLLPSLCAALCTLVTPGENRGIA